VEKRTNRIANIIRIIDNLFYSSC